MHDSLPNDVDHIMIEKNDTFNKVFNFHKKVQASLTGILLDASRLLTISFRGTPICIQFSLKFVPTKFVDIVKGIGYELIPSPSSLSALPGTDCYHFVFLYPKTNNEIDKHIKNLSSLINIDIDHKVKYFFDNVSRLFCCC